MAHAEKNTLKVQCLTRAPHLPLPLPPLPSKRMHARTHARTHRTSQPSTPSKRGSKFTIICTSALSTRRMNPIVSVPLLSHHTSSHNALVSSLSAHPLPSHPGLVLTPCTRLLRGPMPADESLFGPRGTSCSVLQALTPGHHHHTAGKNVICQRRMQHQQ